MNSKETRAIHKPLIGLAIIALCAIVALSWLLANNTDRDMRANLLLQATIASKAIDAANLAKLTGNDADLNSPAYIRLKEQLTSIRAADNHFRFIYIMSIRPNGEIYFNADSEPVSSKDYSPPGQIYQDASNELRGIFDTRAGIVEGPVDDEWGSWVSAVAPINDPRTGNTIAVLGIDIAAHLWNWNLMMGVLPSLGFMALLLGILVVWFYRAIKRIEES